LRLAIEEKVLVRSLVEIDGVELDELAVEDELAAGAELLLLLPLLHAAIRTAAAPAATAVSPALAVTEYNDVPRLFSRDMLEHVRDQIHTPGHLAARGYWRHRRTANRNVPVNTPVRSLKKS
jgi:hypothetical protein